MLLLPDTPRWYYAQGREREGDSILMRLHDAPLEHSAVQNMREGILASIKLEEVDKNSFRLLDLFWDRSDLRAGRRIRISFMILSLQQMMGTLTSHDTMDGCLLMFSVQVSTFLSTTPP